MNSAYRIGIFGGTFDPIHNGHLQVARAALQSAQLDRVLFVVAARPPHKTGNTAATPELRFRLVEAAVASEPQLEASRVELDREGPSYTVDTLKDLQTQQPDAQWSLIIGLDSLVDLPKWKDHQGIYQRARLLVVPRSGEKFKIPKSLVGKYDMLPFEMIDVSSTDIRRRVAAGESIAELVPAPVATLIDKEGYYHDRLADPTD